MYRPGNREIRLFQCGRRSREGFPVIQTLRANYAGAGCHVRRDRPGSISPAPRTAWTVFGGIRYRTTIYSNGLVYPKQGIYKMAQVVRLPKGFMASFGRYFLTRYPGSSDKPIYPGTSVENCSTVWDFQSILFSVQEGSGEAGSDVVVTVGNLLLPDRVEFQIGGAGFRFQRWHFRPKFKRKVRPVA